MPRIIVLFIVTVFAAAFGAFGGQQVFRLGAKATLHAQKPEAATIAALPKMTNVRELKPIVTNLAAPPNTWVRLEAAIVADFTTADAEHLAAEVAGDALAYLRTLSIVDLTGPEALRNLRDDLGERAAIRSNQRVREFIIETLVVQ